MYPKLRKVHCYGSNLPKMNHMNEEGCGISSILNNSSMTILEKGLDAVWLRQQVIAGNIANAATPGYKSKSLQFETLLSRQIGDGAEDEAIREAISTVEPQIVQNEGTTTREDGNNVDLDKENIELARAQLEYSYLTSSINAQINRMKYVINEGRR